MELRKSTTSQIVQVFFLDTTSVTGAGKTGLAYNTAGLTCYYKRNKGTASAAVSLANMTLGTYTDGGFKEVDAAHMPGLYEFGVPDAALATGADGATEVAVMFVAAGAVARPLRFDLIALDKQDSVRAGLTALPNAAAAASGGLPTVDASNAVKVQSGTGANQIALASGAVTVGTNNDKTGYGLADGAITAAKIGSAAIDADALAADAASEIAAAVVAQALTGGEASNTVGGKLNAAGSAGDPLVNAVPGVYTVGSAGYKLGLIGVATVTVVSPVNAQTGDLEIVRGDDYTVSSGRVLPEWSSEGWSAYDLSAAESITFRARGRYSDVLLEKAADALTDTLVRVELTSAETGALAAGREAYRYDVEAILASGDVVTLVQGHIFVIEDVH